MQREAINGIPLTLGQYSVFQALRQSEILRGDLCTSIGERDNLVTVQRKVIHREASARGISGAGGRGGRGARAPQDIKTLKPIAAPSLPRRPALFIALIFPSFLPPF